MQDVGWMLVALVALSAIFVWGFTRGFWQRYVKGRVTVYEHEAGLKYQSGKLVEVLGAGRYATWPAPTEITRLDLREFSATIAGQEILTSDQLSVRVSIIVGYRIADPRAYVLGSSSPIAQLHQAAQTLLRDAVSKRTLDEILTDRDSIVAGMSEALAKDAAALGLRIGAVKLLDLTLAGSAKQAYADLWRAQKEGLAALERARGEHAALRSLANAARMLKNNPELMNLRLLQALSGAPGKSAPTIVLGGGAGLLPVSPGGGEEAGEN
ncbi:MAG TPA: slipin family protein [Caulobacterales bacterium]|nr:slipin family protein [Caulobacterales bacterium]